MGFLSNLFDPAGITTGDSGDFAINSLNPAGGFADNYNLPNPMSNLDNRAGDLVDNVSDFESSNTSDMWHKFINNPAQVFIAGADPLSTKMWNGILGKDWTPYLNQMGGPSDESYRSAESKGIDTSFPQLTHQIAGLVAGGSSSGGLGNAFGAAGVDAGVGATAGKVAGGAAIGAGNAYANDQPILAGAAKGGLGSYAGTAFGPGNNQYNLGNSIGFDNPTFVNGVNGAANGGLRGIINGNGANTGAIVGGIVGAGNSLLNTNSFQQGGKMAYDFNGSMPEPTYNFSANDLGMADLNTPPSFDYSIGMNQPSYGNMTDADRVNALGPNSNSNDLWKKNPVLNFLSGIGGTGQLQQQSSGQAPIPSNTNQSLLGGLASLYLGYKNNKNTQGQISSINGLYGPNSAYATQMQKQLEARDAAAGRRSQYGPRSVELQAALAGNAAKLAPTLAGLYNQQNNNYALTAQTLLRNPAVMNTLNNGYQQGKAYLGNMYNQQQPVVAQQPTQPFNSNEDIWGGI